MPPSRRTVLKTCSIATVGSLAGCIADGEDSDDETTDTPAETTRDDTPTDDPGTPGGSDAILSAHNDTESEQTVTVTVTQDGQQVGEASRTVQPGVRGVLDVTVAESGEYVVEGSIEDGDSATYDWSVGESYRGTLAVVVTDDGVTFRETLENPDCPSDDLPYAVPDAAETFTTGGAYVDNESGETRTVTLSLAHDGETFFSCTQALGPRQSVSIDDLVATAGTYTVTVDVADGGRTTTEWRVPEQNNYPSLRVELGNGDPLVGCGSGGDVRVSVENATDGDRTATLTLRRDGETVAEESVDVAAGESPEAALSTPIGDFYTLVASSDGATAEEEIVHCYCYTSDQTTVTLGESGVSIESTTIACE